LRAPSCNAEKKLKIICEKKFAKKNLPKFFKQSIFASDLQNKQTNMQNHAIAPLKKKHLPKKV